MNGCDVLLLTSLSEGSPTVVKEALACNLPVVSTNVGDVQKRIGALEGCVVCQDDSPQAIAGALIEVLSRGKRLDSSALASELDEAQLVKKIIAVYSEAIQKK